ncbi:MAG: hypothetical protein H0T62_01285 [Parachlamydiaceae bacterium]|nr:hypothetical protein [Parachlamydiaceae bacterium]
MEFSHCLQASLFGETLKEEMYKGFVVADFSTNGKRACGIILAGASALITLGTKVATLGETIIKGVGNVIMGIGTLNGHRILKGLEQLTVKLVVAAGYLLVVAPIYILISSVVTLVATIFIPIEYAEKRAKVHFEEYRAQLMKTGPDAML